MANLDRRVQRLEHELTPSYPRAFIASYEFDDAHRFVGIRESWYAAGRLVSRRFGESLDQLTDRARQEFGLSATDMLGLIHPVYADNVRPCRCANCAAFNGELAGRSKSRNAGYLAPTNRKPSVRAPLGADA